VLGTPWLIWKFLSSLGNEDVNNWMTGTILGVLPF
jgi:hypothetical protein